MKQQITLLILVVCGYIESVTSNGIPVSSMFSSFPASPYSLISATGWSNIHTCLGNCYSNPSCCSVLWDQSRCYCYQFSQTAKQNPTILLNRYGTAYYEKGCGTTAYPTPMPKAPCVSRANTAYFLIPDTEMVPSGNTQSVPYDQENSCITSCTTQPNCWSVTVYPKAKTCSSSQETLPPDGTGTSRLNAYAFYVEKICLPMGVPSTCGDQFFFLFPGKDLYGHTLMVEKASSMSDCAGRCAITPGCKAGIFMASGNTCTLKNGDAIGFKDDLKPAPAGTYYFENGCLIGQTQPVG